MWASEGYWPLQYFITQRRVLLLLVLPHLDQHIVTFGEFCRILAGNRLSLAGRTANRLLCFIRKCILSKQYIPWSTNLSLSMGLRDEPKPIIHHLILQMSYILEQTIQLLQVTVSQGDGFKWFANFARLQVGRPRRGLWRWLCGPLSEGFKFWFTTMALQRWVFHIPGTCCFHMFPWVSRLSLSQWFPGVDMAPTMKLDDPMNGCVQRVGTVAFGFRHQLFNGL